MGAREAKRLEIVLSVENRTLSSVEGAKRLGVTERQRRRIRKRYRIEGISGLVSKRKGLPARNHMAEDLRRSVSGLVAQHYQGFGPTLVQEKLAEQHAIDVSIESIRQLMILDGQWKTRRGKRIAHHPTRQRRARYFDLIQIDGSPHHWFGDRSPACTLLVFIDDATGHLMHLAFVPSESTLSYMQALSRPIDTHGLPECAACISALTPSASTALQSAPTANSTFILSASPSCIVTSKGSIMCAPAAGLSQLEVATIGVMSTRP